MLNGAHRLKIKLADDFEEQPAVIKVVGVGGAGGNGVNRMVDAGVRHVDFIAVNSDAQDLRRNKAALKIQIGEKGNKGLGVGGDPSRGRKAGEEAADPLREALAGADLIFVTAGMGGGTGTGAAPVVARLARESGALTVGVVSRPFRFEAKVRADQAEAGIRDLRAQVDTLLIIPNEKLLSLIDENTTTDQAFRMADDVLRQAVQSITDVITTPGEINVDFADIRTLLKSSGEALMGMGRASGPNRALEAAKHAIDSPMLDNVVIDGAKGVMVNITGSRAVRFREIQEAMEFIHSQASPEAMVFYGQAFDENMGEEIRVTVIATGFPPRQQRASGFAAPRRAPLLAASRAHGLKAAPAPSSVRGLPREEAESHPIRLPSHPVSDAAALEDLWRRPAYLRIKPQKLK
jgi:cell division protein FtsZ